MVSMVATQDYTWEQGEDLILEIIYQIDGQPVDLTGYSVRMDLAPKGSQAAVFTFNSDDLDDPLDAEGTADNEAVLTTDGRIHIHVPRALTLAGGVIGDLLPTTPEYNYDLFLRTPSPNNTQKKLLQGKILVRSSITRWS